MIPMPDDYTVRLVDMPTSVGGRIEEGPDGHLDVYINARLSNVGQHTAAYHEWEHWLNDDLHSDRDIREVEGHVPSRKPGKLPPLIKARDLIRPKAVRFADAPEWRDDMLHRMQDYRDG